VFKWEPHGICVKTEELFDEVASCSPGFAAVMREHIADNDGLLPHLLMADLLLFVGARAAYSECREELVSIFRLLDVAFVSGDVETENAIAVSFIEDIGAELFLINIEPYFGPALKAEYLRSSWRRT
jgi:hypothetical protein